MTRIFVYGTLKRGHCNSHILAQGEWPNAKVSCRFLSKVITKPYYAIYDCGGYPGLVVAEKDGEGIEGEVWKVDDETLHRLHRLEGVHEGLYKFEPIELENEWRDVYAYYYEMSVISKNRISRTWPAELDYGRRSR